MAWMTPIRDRTQADVTNRTAKGFWNVADWTRVNGNNAALAALYGTWGYPFVALASLTTPKATSTTTPPATSDVTIPRASDLNALLENINRLIRASGLPSPTCPALLPMWSSGPLVASPNYRDANAWEGAQWTLYTYIPIALYYQAHCGVPACGSSHLWQTRFRGS